MATYGDLKQGEEFTFTSDPRRTVCTKLSATSYSTEMGGVYDVAKLNISSLSDSTTVKRIRAKGGAR